MIADGSDVADDINEEEELTQETCDKISPSLLSTDHTNCPHLTSADNQQLIRREIIENTAIVNLACAAYVSRNFELAQTRIPFFCISLQFSAFHEMQILFLSH